MKDFVTEAFTLALVPSRDMDRTACLFTRDFGRIDARVVSGRKILSKFTPHLEPMRHVTVRLAKKAGFTVTDAYTNSIFHEIRNDVGVWNSTLKSLNLIRALTAKEQPDMRFWYEIDRMMKSGSLTPLRVLAYSGYDAVHAQCDACGDINPTFFVARSHSFFCKTCGSKIQESLRVVL